MISTLYSNQKAIRVVKAQSNKENTYSIFNHNALRKAMKLPPPAFKVWAYLNSHQNGYEFGLSSKDVKEVCSMAKKTYDNAIAVLIEKGYLVQVELYPNLTGYLFIEEGYGGIEEKKKSFH